MEENSGVINRVYKFCRKHKQKALLVGAVTGGVLAYNNSEIVKDTVDRTWNWLLKRLPIPVDGISGHFSDITDEDSSSKGKKDRRRNVDLNPKSHEGKQNEEELGNIADNASVASTCLQILDTAVPLINELIDRRMNQIRDEIKLNPPNKLDLWEEMKIISWSRFFVSLYTVCHLVVYVKVQTGVAGRFLSQQNAESERDLQLKLQIISKHVQGADYPVAAGLRQLTKVVKSVVAKSVAPRALQDVLSMEDVKQVVYEVRKLMEMASTESPSVHCRNYHMEFLVPAEQLDVNVEREPLTNGLEERALLNLTEEVNRALKSFDCNMVLDCCLEICFSRFLKEVDTLLKDRSSNRPPNCPAGLPHAALLPAISRASNLFIKSADAELIVKELVDLQYFQPFVNRIITESLQRDSLAE